MEHIVAEILAAAARDGWVLEPDAKALLARIGIDVPAGRVAHSEEEAITIARELNSAVVAKVVSSEIIHKTEVDGVITGLRGDDAIRGAFARFSRLSGFRGMLIEEMVSGVELIVGGRFDAQFGAVVLLGIGGTGVEIYRDVVVRLAPVEAADVPAMISELIGAPLLAGHRGAPVANTAALAETVAVFSRLLAALGPRFSSADLNPVFCSPTRCVVADARILIEG